jgi:hypothetical protein
VLRGGEGLTRLLRKENRVKMMVDVDIRFDHILNLLGKTLIGWFFERRILVQSLNDWS